MVGKVGFTSLMKIVIQLLITIFSCWEVVPSNDKIDDQDEQSSPLALIGTVLGTLNGLQCRKGFYNLSDEIYDAVYHCAGIKPVMESRLIFGDEKVQFDGPTPLLCLKVCYVRNLGVIYPNSSGFDEDKAFALISKSMPKPGGEASARQVTKELKNCETKHPIVYPRVFRDCTDTNEFITCTRKVFADCSDKTKDDGFQLGRSFPLNPADHSVDESSSDFNIN